MLSFSSGRTPCLSSLLDQLSEGRGGGVICCTACTYYDVCVILTIVVIHIPSVHTHCEGVGVIVLITDGTLQQTLMTDHSSVPNQPNLTSAPHHLVGFTCGVGTIYYLSIKILHGDSTEAGRDVSRRLEPCPIVAVPVSALTPQGTSWCHTWN